MTWQIINHSLLSSDHWSPPDALLQIQMQITCIDCLLEAKNHEVPEVVTIEVETMECVKIETVPEVFTVDNGALLQKAQEVVEVVVAYKRKNMDRVVGFTNKIELHFIIIV